MPRPVKSTRLRRREVPAADSGRLRMRRKLPGESANFAKHRVIPADGRSPTTKPSPEAPPGYPWASDTTFGNDPYGLTKRQCVSYVAWYLSSLRIRTSTASG